MLNNWKTIVILLMASFLIAGSGSAAKDAKKVAILPFQINAAKDLSYLREGIQDMLASRLAWEGEVEVIEKQAVKKAMAAHPGPLNEEMARKVGQILQADYVLFGSLTIFGDSVSIDAKMLALTEDRPAVTVYEQTKGMDEVIPRINDFAQDINNKIFGRSPTVVAAQPQPRFSQADPEKLLTARPPPTGTPRQDGGTSFVRLQPDTGEGQTSDLWRSQKLEFAVNGMAVGDIDGDGRQEIVVLARFKEVVVYHWEEGRLLKHSSLEGSLGDRFVWVCTWDANYDGRDEIYVSNLRNDILSSHILGWEGGRLVRLASKQRWYFNRVTLPGKGPVLLGQKKNPEQIFVPGIYQLQCSGGDCQPVEAITVPSKANVFNFVQADVTGNGQVETVLIGFEDKLYLMDANGEQLWVSRDYYGATANLISGKSARDGMEAREMTHGATVEDVEERYYIPSQLTVVDFNGDRKLEILVNRNVSFVARLLMRSRDFSDAQIQSMFWEGYELIPQWKTRPLRGMVVSYHLADVDGDGMDELVAAVALEGETFKLFKKSKSMLFVYELDRVVQPGSSASSTPTS
jgi:TolB-like protein